MTSETPKWTPEQKAGIETTGVNLLVSAAAGSGKTAVLSERCAYLVCDATPTCDVDQLLVVTFTEAAAAEMKGRIEAALRKRLERDPEDNRLRAQVAQIDRARVSTLHGFCSGILRQHFHLLNLDPGFSILDGDEARLLRLEVVRDLFADRYETDENGVFQKLIDTYGDGREDTLHGHVIHTHELLGSLIDPEEWLAVARGRIAEGANQPLRNCDLGKELAGIIHHRLSSLADRCATAIRTVRQLGGFGKYVEHLETYSETIDVWILTFGNHDFDALAVAVTEFKPAKKPSIKNDTPGKGVATAAFDPIQDEMGKKGSLRPLIRFTSEEWSTGLKSIQPFAEVFLDLVEAFDQRYTAAKERARGVDFADLERLSLKLLRTRENGKWVPSPVARACHRQIAHVLVDEYQDINGVQEAILNLVSHECLPPDSGHSATPNLFCVGDVKQSIYGFRLAEPARFLERYDRFKSDAAEGRVIDLQANFRSRAPLLNALNGLFARLMTKEAADLDYDESQELRPGAIFPAAIDSPSFSGAPIELHILPKNVEPSEDVDEAGGDLDRSEREASFIASRIHEMMGHGGSPPMHVADRGPDGKPILRPIQRRDIVILLRSTVMKAEQFAGILRRHGIPVHRDSGTGYFNSTEIRDMLALLHLLDNSRQDIPLATVLRSPLANLPMIEDSLARIRLAYPDAEDAIPFHEAVTQYAAEQKDELAARLNEFITQMNEWRTISRLRPLAELIWRIYEDTGYLSYCSGLENGEQRCANLTFLHTKAQQFGGFSRQGLYRFLRFLSRLQTESDLGLPSILGPGEDVVRIMSVHRSKGLEFPVVFLPDLGKRFNLRDSTNRVLVDRARFLGLPAVDEVKQVRYPSLASLLVSERLRQQAMAEELRVLYVATTRAREHLILVGTCDVKLPERWKDQYGSHKDALPADAVLSAGSMLDWIGPVAAAFTGEGTHDFEVILHAADEIEEWSLSGSVDASLTPEQARYAALKPLDIAPPPNAIADAVIQRLAYVYPYREVSEFRAAMPVTEWIKNQKNRTESVLQSSLRNKSPLRLPRAVAGKLAMSATDKGTATHLVLEHLDFVQSCDAISLQSQIDGMLDRKLIAKEEAAAVDRGAIEWFAGGELGQLIRGARREDVIREIAFNLAQPQTVKSSGNIGLSPLDQLMLRGRIDLLIRVDDSFMVIDYKTDQVTAAQVEARKESYQPQVQLYRQAIEKLTGVRVGAVYLVFLAPRIISAM